MLRIFCVGRIEDGQVDVWMPIQEDPLYTVEDAISDEELQRLMDKDDEVNEAQSEFLDWRT